MQGVSLRFPRFLRLREDKRPEQATTARELWCLYVGQFSPNNPRQIKESTALVGDAGALEEEATEEVQQAAAETPDAALAGAFEGGAGVPPGKEITGEGENPVVVD